MIVFLETGSSQGLSRRSQAGFKRAVHIANQIFNVAAAIQHAANFVQRLFCGLALRVEAS